MINIKKKRLTYKKLFLLFLKLKTNKKISTCVKNCTNLELINYFLFFEGGVLQQNFAKIKHLRYLTNTTLVVNKNAHIKILPGHYRSYKKTGRRVHGQLEMSKYFLHLYPLLRGSRSKQTHMHFNILRSYWWYRFYLNAVTQQYTMFMSNWMFIECSQLMQRGFYKKIFNSLYKKNFLRKLYARRDKFLHWFTKFTVFKDISIFVSMILRWLFFSPIRKHRRIFVLINNFLRVWYAMLYDYKKIKGYCIFFKGKLGRKGSVRKTKYFSKRGEVSYSTKSLRLSYKTFHFGTRTGVVGGGLSLFYYDFAYILLLVHIHLRANAIFYVNFFCDIPD